MLFASLTSGEAFLVALAVLCAGAIGSLMVRDERLVNALCHGTAILASLFALASAIAVLVTGAGFTYVWHTTLPQLSIMIGVDSLAAVLIAAIAIVALCASLYGLGYMRHYIGSYGLRSFGFFYNAFILGMLLVASAQHAVFFLVVWEVMSLASYFLVVFEHKEPAHIQAGAVYFIMTHVGTACIALAFLLLFVATDAFDFSAIREQAGMLTGAMKNAVFLLALVGFGVKAGVIPFHIWLPSAHPAAPSHVSALMSGVMIKTGIYMLIRLFADVLGIPLLWWGMLILGLGAISALLGVLYALTEHDLKRLLAYHSIENIGIILLGLGSGLVFLSLHKPSLALIGLSAALFHTLNHAIFKALLFLGAGAVIERMRTRNMEEYGGLIRYMPRTALFFLVGSLAISALPPFNGFFSEWMTFQSLFAGMRHADASVLWMFAAAAGALAFTGGLAAACFVKAFGGTFLARPRSSAVRHASEVAFPMQIGMAILALLALLIGVFAGHVADMLMRAAQGLSTLSDAEPVLAAGRSLSIDGFATVHPILLGIGLASLLALTWLASRRLVRRTERVTGTWSCGIDLEPRMEITATGFSRSIIVMFKGVLKPSVQETIEYRDAQTRYFPHHRAVSSSIKDIYRAYLYGPIEGAATLIAGHARRIQSGNLNTYVLYTFMMLVALLLVLL